MIIATLNQQVYNIEDKPLTKEDTINMQCTAHNNFLHKKIPYLHALQGNREMGARYLDPKYSRWISVDPALGEYIPAAGKGNSENAGNLPGMGGIYNHINGDLYHYAGNNPVRYIDPDGRFERDWTKGQLIVTEEDVENGCNLQVGERTGDVLWEYSLDADRGVHINFFPDKWTKAIEKDENGNNKRTNIHIAAEKIEREPGIFYVGAHGNPNTIFDRNGDEVEFELFIEAIWNHPEFTSDMTIKLLSCNTGNDSSGNCLAMDLASVFEVSVQAPNDYLCMDSINGYYWVDNDGVFNCWIWE